MPPLCRCGMGVTNQQGRLGRPEPRRRFAGIAVPPGFRSQVEPRVPRDNRCPRRRMCRAPDRLLQPTSRLTAAHRLAHLRALVSLAGGRLPERTNGAASKAVVASGSPWVRIPHLPPSACRRSTAVVQPLWRYAVAVGLTGRANQSGLRRPSGPGPGRVLAIHSLNTACDASVSTTTSP